MSNKRRTQEERANETRKRLVAAALEVLKKKGYAGFRVTDVTETAGLSRGAQTHHFPTKLDLLLATFAWLYDQLTERSRARIVKLKPSDDIFQQMLDDASDFFLGEDFSIGLDLIVAADRDPELQVGIHRIVQDRRFLVEDMWLENLIRNGLSRDDAEDLLWLIFNTMRGLATRSLWQKDDQRFEHVKKLTLEIVRDRYGHLMK